MTEPGDEIAAGAGDGGRLPVCPLDRENVMRTLKAALAQGRLTEDEYDARAAQTSASRSHAELATLTADLPAGLVAVRPPRGSDVWIGVALITAAASVLAPILLWRPDNALAFLAALGAAATLLVAPLLTVGLIVDVRYQRRSGGQPPPGPPA